jgi:hypothetical protein
VANCKRLKYTPQVAGSNRQSQFNVPDGLEEVVHGVPIFDATQDSDEEPTIDETEPLDTHATTSGVPTQSYGTFDESLRRDDPITPPTNLSDTIYNGWHALREVQEQDFENPNNAAESEGDA